MTVSPGSSEPISSSSVDCTMAAGNISQTARGLSSLEARSASESAPTAPSPTSSFTAASLTS